MPAMPRRRSESVLSALGVSESDERRYQQVLPLSGSPLEGVAVALGVPVERLSDPLRGLLAEGMVSFEAGRLYVLPLSQVVSAAIGREAAAAVRTRDRLDELARSIEFLSAAGSRPAPGEVEDLGRIDGEVSAGGNALALLTALIESSKGDLLFLRPDTWAMPRESAISRVVGRAVASGRRSRAIYPFRALNQVPEVLRARMDEGEEVRVIDAMPTRLFVIGGTHAVLPEPLGFADEPRLLVRQGALVEALTLLFELYWERSSAVPDTARHRIDERAFLVRQLASGAKDEQIARTLGLSLRTVRRRVADLMIQLGVDTRFQAGAEAVRRGWL
jgi:DNA-binding CsgD family transcriptional regulator